MIISYSQCWTCCLRQFDACPLTAHHLAIERGRKRRQVQALHYHQLFCEFGWWEKCRFVCFQENYAVTLQGAQSAEWPKSQAELQSCCHAPLMSWDCYLTIHRGENKTQSLHLGIETISYSYCSFSSLDSKVDKTSRKWAQHSPSCSKGTLNLAAI